MATPNPSQVGGSVQGGIGTVASQQAPKLKYISEITKIAGCPPMSCQGSACQGYRFAPASLSDKAFLPVALVTPQRILRGRPITQCCTAYSLSLFQTLDQLRKRAEEGKKTAPNFLKRVGDHFVRLDISASDGVSSAPNGHGHFDFFERVTFDALKCVVEHGELMP